ncbi:MULTISPECIES: hypothetical protein [Mesorhizobium]|uniref:Fe/B12 periplasmic-binding domain-containing protein n=2 Tax=Mesorhizobium TaxID=68287 RepID=A0ABW4WAC3_9HYPH
MTAALEPHRVDRLRGRITRRGALGLFALPFTAMASPSAAAKPLRIVCLDDGLAETLLMLGVSPIAIADRDVWETWVVEPSLPPDVVDVGTLLEPNLELLQELAIWDGSPL